MFYEVEVQDLQDVFDISIQEYGTVGAIHLLLIDNPAVNTVRELKSGELLKIRRFPSASDVPDRATMNYFRDNQLTVVNRDTSAPPKGAYSSDYSKEYD